MACKTKKRCGGPVKKKCGGAVGSKLPKKRQGGGVGLKPKGLGTKKGN